VFWSARRPSACGLCAQPVGRAFFLHSIAVWPETLIEKMQVARRRANRLGTLRHYPPRPLRLPARYGQDGHLEDSPTISIVTPSLNQARFLEDTIESVLGQAYPSLEYVIQDGGSGDGSREVVERYSGRLHSWESAPDGGQASALNRGFARTSGEVMASLNADDLLLPGTVAYVAGFLRRNPSVDLVYGHRVLIDEAGRDIGRQVIPRHDDRVLSWADFIPQETVFWRRGAWEAAGACFDESFQCAMDWDLLVRLRDAGARMVRLPRFLGAFRVHGEQKTAVQGPTIGIEEMQRIRERLHGRPVSQKEVLRRVRRYLIRHVVLDRAYRSRLLRY
jgi:GT2 family glycosyltransferase